MSAHPPVTPEAITARLLRDECGSGAYERGLGYFRQGRAIVDEVQSDGAGAIALYTTSRGSGGRFYEQEIILDPGPRGPTIDGVCTCPMDYNCKHVVAACLAWKAEARGAPVAGQGFDHWLTRFDGGGAGEDEPSGESVLYTLSTARDGRTTVGFVIASRKADGGWKKGRRAPQSILSPYYTSAPRYMHPEDMEILKSN